MIFINPTGKTTHHVARCLIKPDKWHVCEPSRVIH